MVNTASSHQRRCLATGEVKATSEMVRFVIGPAGEVVPDVEAKLPGRGLWVTARRDDLERAVQRGAFARGARRAVSVDPSLVDLVERQLARRCGELLSLSNRAGLVVAGFEKVRATTRAGKAVVVLSGADGSEQSRRKLHQPAGGAVSVMILTCAELSLALGRENVVHAALSRGGLADRLLAELSRLAGLRAQTVTVSG